jgi:sec-independent protein translocase protein TatA
VLGLDNPLHILMLLVILLLVFGAKRLPEMGKSLGTGLRGFKESLSGEESHSGFGHTETTATPVAATPSLAAAAQPVTAPVSPETTEAPARETVGVAR